ncbi:RCC1-like domain-containing protein [Plantactinospora sp. CA-294935]|uniref:RCC1-like domain-containing protein n=1 Tax=Plantactinospora sp. CA-294935 TaxID=3240012 RepID=UPI003D8DBD76
MTLGSRLPAPVAGWGRNGSFELGNGSSLDYRAPGRVALPAGTTVGDVAAGYHHGLVATSTGGVLGWGANGNGQLGDGTTTSRAIPVPVSLPAGTVVTAVAAGLAHSLALTDTGQVYAWGRNGAGQLGDGTTVSRTSPVPVSLPTGVTITAIAAYNVHSLGLTTTGQVYAWGNNTYGQLGDGTTVSRSTPVPVSLPAGTTATGLAAGGFHSLARTAAGPVLAWGYNSVGQLGDGSTTSRSTPVPVSLPGGTTVTSLAAGLLHSLAVTSTGQALAWGSNSVGQLGDGTITNRSTPVSVSLPAGTTVTAVAGGSVHSLAATSTGLVLGWGRNNYGQLGNIDIPVSSQVPVPTTQPLATPAVDVTAGEHHSLAR